MGSTGSTTLYLPAAQQFAKPLMGLQQNLGPFERHLIQDAGAVELFYLLQFVFQKIFPGLGREVGAWQGVRKQRKNRNREKQGDGVGLIV